MVHTNGIEGVWGILKPSIVGTFRWISVKHLPLYVAEFEFKLNEGSTKIDTVDRLDALIRGTKGKRLTYKMLTKGT
jgi:hypothetical protein